MAIQPQGSTLAFRGRLRTFYNQPMAQIMIFLCLAAQALGAESFDIVIRDGRVIDGTGSPWYAADIGIRGGRIAAIGSLRDVKAAQVISARGMVVAPGFIDMLGQSEQTIL